MEAALPMFLATNLQTILSGRGNMPLFQESEKPSVEPPVTKWDI